MDDKNSKIQRSSYFIKGFMALVIIIQAYQFYQTNIIDFGAIAGSIGILALLRGLLLSPILLTVPIKAWFTLSNALSKESYKYFILAFVLLIVAAF